MVFFTFALKSNYRYHHAHVQCCVCLLTRKMEGWGEGNSNPLMRWVGLGGIWKIIRDLGERDPSWTKNWVLVLFYLGGLFGSGVEYGQCCLQFKRFWSTRYHSCVLSSTLLEGVIRVMEVKVLSSPQPSPAGRMRLCVSLWQDRRLTAHQPFPLFCASRSWFCSAIRWLFLDLGESRLVSVDESS